MPLDNWRIDAHLTAAAGGYTHQSLELWGPGNGSAMGAFAQAIWAMRTFDNQPAFAPLYEKLWNDLSHEVDRMQRPAAA